MWAMPQFWLLLQYAVMQLHRMLRGNACFWMPFEGKVDLATVVSIFFEVTKYAVCCCVPIFSLRLVLASVYDLLSVCAHTTNHTKWLLR
ncbi:hypothetical protein BC829DRAFT_395899, partial [Chytridium lagenaria]